MEYKLSNGDVITLCSPEFSFIVKVDKLEIVTERSESIPETSGNTNLKESKPSEGGWLGKLKKRKEPAPSEPSITKEKEKVTSDFEDDDKLEQQKKKHKIAEEEDSDSEESQQLTKKILSQVTESPVAKQELANELRRSLEVARETPPKSSGNKNSKNLLKPKKLVVDDEEFARQLDKEINSQDDDIEIIAK